MVASALKELGVTVDEAVYVGDSDVDLQTARNSGLPCISVLWGFRDRRFLIDHGATELVETPSGLCTKMKGC
jgi:phosphoglycolate phosphatase